MRTKPTRATIHVILIALTVALAVIGLKHWGALQRLEWISFDQRIQSARADAKAPDDIAVILIDEASLQAMNPLLGRYPWPRSVYADLLDFLSLGHPRAVVFDILFSENEKDAPHATAMSRHDQRLIDTTRRTGFTYHTAQIIHDAGIHGPGAALPADFAGRFSIPQARGFDAGDNNSFTLPLNGLYQASRGVGMAGLNPDSDGVYRRVKLFRSYHGDVYPALSVAPLVNGTGTQTVARRGARLLFGHDSIPLDVGGNYLINPYHHFNDYSIAGVFSSLQMIRAGDVQNLVINPNEFKNKVVFVGASAVGLEDLKATSLASATPGVYLHASVAGNLLSGDFLSTVPAPVTALLIIALALATGTGIVLTRGFAFQLMLPLVLGGAYTAWVYWRFRHNVVYDLTAPLLAVALTWLSVSYHGYVTEGKDKRRIRKMFSQYVSPTILTELVDQYGNCLKPGSGRRECITVLFSDIRDFTSISERLAAEMVVELLNTHFHAMTDVIFEHHGTLDKFIGDALMAYWGAPVKRDDHALLAVTAAIQMERRIREVNKILLSKDYPAVRIGIGINTGEAIVGNIGSEKKLDYTVIGDNVNAASRLEGLTSKYKQTIVISDTTYAEVKDTIPCAVLDKVKVKGKSTPMTIYVPLAAPDDPPEAVAAARALARQMELAYGHYLAQEWRQAREIYQHLPDGDITRMFINRCQEFMRDAPVAEWDGTTTFTSK